MLARCTSSLDLHMLIVPFWYLFRTLLVPKVALGRAINDGFDKGKMSPTQKEGIIICIPKGDKPGEYLKQQQQLETYFIVECCL